MKLKVLNIIICLLIVACNITSCLDSDRIEYEFSSNSSITAFSITDSIVTYYPAVVNGKDTTLSTAVVGTNYSFTINQNEGLIYNPDSLPVGTDISKVVVNITADTKGIYIVAEKDSLWEETDSLNFEKPVQFKVLAENGAFGRIYTAQINVHKQDPDKLGWQKLESNFASNIEKQKAVYLNNYIYVFAIQEGQAVVTKTSTANGSIWSEPIRIDTPSEADITSAMAWGNQLYILANHELYTSQDGFVWNKIETTTNIQQLIANVSSDNTQRMIGVDTDNHYIASQDGSNWEQHGEMPTGFPTNNLSYVSYALETNKDIHRIIVMGDNESASDSTVVVWTQLDSEDYWTDLISSENSHACPKLENMSMIRYNNQLYVFGGSGQNNESIKPFSTMYVSKDNGIAWQTAPEKIAFPEEFQAKYEESDGNYSCIVDENQSIWMMWSQSGEVWKGRINRLGFEKQ
ncbi:MAG: hypothetical protein IJE78_13790 [Bacteroidaceae bacterium]|nr:hypothetical protein [Bacteroidaceae bacterium]